MAIYHLHAKVIGRGKGRNPQSAVAYRSASVIKFEARSVVAAAAYRSGQKLANDREGRISDFTLKAHNVEHSEILAPDHAPHWVWDRESLWNEVDRKEDESRRKATAQTAREIEFALPRELNQEQRLELSRSFIERFFVASGMVADFSIHNDKENHNPHVHCMLTMRDISKEGFGNKNREWNNKSQLELWRRAWAVEANQALERAGSNERIDHRSYKERGIDQIPTIHEGFRARKGHVRDSSLAVTRANKLGNFREVDYSSFDQGTRVEFNQNITSLNHNRIEKELMENGSVEQLLFVQKAIEKIRNEKKKYQQLQNSIEKRKKELTEKEEKSKQQQAQIKFLKQRQEQMMGEAFKDPKSAKEALLKAEREQKEPSIDQRNIDRLADKVGVKREEQEVYLGSLKGLNTLSVLTRKTNKEYEKSKETASRMLAERKQLKELEVQNEITQSKIHADKINFNKENSIYINLREKVLSKEHAKEEQELIKEKSKLVKQIDFEKIDKSKLSKEDKETLTKEVENSLWNERNKAQSRDLEELEKEEKNKKEEKKALSFEERMKVHRKEQEEKRRRQEKSKEKSRERDFGRDFDDDY